MTCITQCKLCPRLIISNSVTVVTVNGVDTLVIDIPSAAYMNCYKYCIVVAQTVPTTATITMPVAFSVGGDTTTVYPFVNCNCTPVTACAIQSRTKYPVLVSTTSTGGSFKSLRKLNCYNATVPTVLPVAAATAAAATADISVRTFDAAPSKVINTTTTTIKTIKEVQ